jgi:hypothetical protein
MLFTRVKPIEETIAGFLPLPELERPWLDGFHERGGRFVPRLRTALSWPDRLGALARRFGLRRNDYRVMPGLYATGDPAREDPVLVTANYKLSVDALRKELDGLALWILVLDTKGINVWCAAGKGSFGTDELIGKIKATRLSELVSHKTLVLPQLGAPGVSAPALAKRTGWRALWGPVRASDLRAYLAAGMKKDEAMSRVRFGALDRLTLAPLELVQAWPILAAGFALALIGGIASLASGTQDAQQALSRAAKLTAAAGGIWLLGGLGFPLLLPFLPSRAFALKGAVLGLAGGTLSALALGYGDWQATALVLASGAAVSYLGMNFTGAASFTSHTGALLEVKRAIVPQALAMAAAGIAAVIGIFA